MTIRVSYTLKSDPYTIHIKTFTGWDRKAVNERIYAWEQTLGDELLEWNLVNR